jgi:hypothetical protein
MEFITFFLISVGVSIFVFWIYAIIYGKIPELKYEPIRVYFHIIAEIGTAILLLTSGYFLIVDHKFSSHILYLGMGMLLYSLIASFGYYFQKRNWIFIGLFTLLLSLEIWLLFNNAVLKS